MVTTTLAFLISLVTAAAPQAAPQVSAMAIGAPHQVVMLDKIKGEPIQMAWSPDGKQLYVQTGEKTRIGTFQNPRHYLVTIADGKAKDVDAAPAWATDYQSWKSNKWAPGLHSMAIDISDEKRTQRSVNAPMGGALAKGGADATGTSADDVVSAAMTSQLQHVITLRLKGETVGEYVDTQFVPGYTFSWAPETFGPAIAYGNPDGRLAVMDAKGDKKAVDGTKNVLVPAWSTAGDHIAFLQKDGKKYAVMMVDVK
jgi:hypothetical protein